MEKAPIKLTKKEKRLSIADIAELIPEFSQQESIKRHKEFGWKIRLEHDIAFLEQARVMMQVNRLVSGRKDKLSLTKEGRTFLTELSPLDQYVRMVHTYWEEVNWGYFDYGVEVAGRKSMTKLFQADGAEIWRALKNYGYEWCDYGEFCQALDGHFDLGRYKDKWDGGDWLKSDVYRALFRFALIRLGCVEIEKFEDGHRYLWEIEKFRPTYLGLYVLERYMNYLGTGPVS